MRIFVKRCANYGPLCMWFIYLYYKRSSEKSTLIQIFHNLYLFYPTTDSQVKLIDFTSLDLHVINKTKFVFDYFFPLNSVFHLTNSQLKIFMTVFYLILFVVCSVTPDSPIISHLFLKFAEMATRHLWKWEQNMFPPCNRRRHCH